MGTYRISEAAERTGLSPPTIRYYEEIGLIPAAARAGSGHRVYDDRSLERLAFVAGARGLGIRLDDVRELAAIWDLDECAPVQQRLAALVAGRIDQTEDRIAGLLVLREQLRAAAARLAAEPDPGPCGDACACAAGPGDGSEPPIACTLDAGARPGRLDEWRALLARAVAREPIAGGLRVTLPAETALAGEVATLAAAEQACC